MPFGLNLGHLGATRKSSMTIGPDTTVSSAWAGAVTDTTFTAAHYLGADTSGARLAVSVNSDLSSPVYSSRARSSSKTVKHTISGLTPNTAYYFGIEINGVVKTTKKGQFKTMPSGASSGSQINFRFSVTQCQNGADNGKAYGELRGLATKPLFNILNGDMFYDNISTDSEALFDAAYEAVLGGTYAGPFLREIPQYRIHDDNDYGPPDSDSTSASRPSSLAAFRRRTPTPSLVYSGALDPVNYSFVQGRLRFIVTDTRSQKDTTTILGATQKQWFKDQIAAAYAAGQFVCWVSAAPWNGTDWSDGWSRNATVEAERRELATAIVDAGMGSRCFVIAGDAHAIQIDDYTNGDFSHGGGLRMPSITASPAYSTTAVAIGGPYSYGASIWTKRSQVGYFDVTDNGASGLSIAFTAIGMDAAEGSATQLASYTFSLPVSAPASPTGVTLVQEYHEHVLQGPTSIPITLRAAPTQGNLLVMNVVQRSGGTTLTVSGWTKIGTDIAGTTMKTASYYKVAGSSESATITLTLAGARDLRVSVFEISGADTSSPIGQDVKDDKDATNVNGVSMAYTNANDNEWALVFAAVNLGNSVTGARVWSSGVVERSYLDPMSLTTTGYAVGSKQLGAAGSGTITFDYTGTANKMHGRLLTIKPAPGGGVTVAQGRRSAINLMSPWRSPLVVPDGSIIKKDRQQLVYCYSEVAA